MHTRLLRILSLTCLTALMATSCVVTRKPKDQVSVERGKVLEVMQSYRRPGDRGGSTLFGAAHLGILGSMIGSGSAAHVIGAASGALIGGTLGYVSSGPGMVQFATIRMDKGGVLELEVPAKQRVRPGQYVWVVFNGRKMPKILEAPAAG